MRPPTRDSEIKQICLELPNSFRGAAQAFRILCCHTTSNCGRFCAVRLITGTVKQMTASSSLSDTLHQT